MAIPEDDEEKTRIMRRPGHPPPLPQDDDTNITNRSDRSPSPAGDDEGEGEMTRLVGPARRLSGAAAPAAPENGGSEADPVVGWLVVMAGPGRGNSVKLGYGQNSVGRDREERVRVDFGDGSISRKRHCYIIYEPRKRQYILRAGDSANLTYLNGELVSETMPLTGGNLIEIGKTTLRFVPFCGADFDWQDEPAAPAASA
jgi:hypothetical protein